MRVDAQKTIVHRCVILLNDSINSSLHIFSYNVCSHIMEGIQSSCGLQIKLIKAGRFVHKDN